MKVIFIFWAVCLCFLTISPAVGVLPQWSYVGERGPAEWGTLAIENKMCSMGKQQSPIDITQDNIKENSELPVLNFSYKIVPLKMQNNGHTIQSNLPKGSLVTIGEVDYELLHFHVHTPSEHAINGKRSELEVHFVHKSREGRIVIIAVLFAKGKNNLALKTFFNKMPMQVGRELVLSDFMLNPNDFLPKNKNYYTYAGSFSTPLCSEVVTWYILKENSTVSYAQIRKFRKLFPLNARPLQSTVGRIVEEK